MTALHVLAEAERHATEAAATSAVEADEAAIRSDTSLDKKEKGRRLRKLPSLSDSSITHSSVWFGIDGVTLTDIRSVNEIDLAFGRLHPWDPGWIASFPVFKAPANMPNATSLCRLGFPFHHIQPTFVGGNFQLPVGSLPIPFFPNDGIFTRTVNVIPDPAPNPPNPFPLAFLETSTPGLRGQSGGPIFDVQGTIWAIQSRTNHLSLGFDPPIPGRRDGATEHQFLNVGLGIHAQTLVGAMKHFGIAFQESAY